MFDITMFEVILLVALAGLITGLFMAATRTPDNNDCSNFKRDILVIDQAHAVLSLKSMLELDEKMNLTISNEEAQELIGRIQEDLSNNTTTMVNSSEKHVLDLARIAFRRLFKERSYRNQQ
jgi:hypothetical protein